MGRIMHSKTVKEHYVLEKERDKREENQNTAHTILVTDDTSIYEVDADCMKQNEKKS